MLNKARELSPEFTFYSEVCYRREVGRQCSLLSLAGIYQMQIRDID